MQNLLKICLPSGLAKDLGPADLGILKILSEKLIFELVLHLNVFFFRSKFLFKLEIYFLGKNWMT